MHGSAHDHEGEGKVYRSFRTVLLLTAFAALAFPSSAGAQRLFRVGVGGGLTIPVADLSDVAQQGYHGQVMLGISIPLFPISMRLDAAYHQLPAGADGHLRQFSATANARVAGTALPVTPYLIAGIGMYYSRFTEGAVFEDAELGTEARTDFGINVGAGLLFRLGLVQAFVDGRYHHVFDGQALTHAPVTVGIMF